MVSGETYSWLDGCSVWEKARDIDEISVIKQKIAVATKISVLGNFCFAFIPHAST
jgi:hypothetical protein